MTPRVLLPSPSARRWTAAALLMLAAAVTTACNNADQSQSSRNNSSSSSNSNGNDTTEQNSYTINDKVVQIKLDSRAGGVNVVAADGPIQVTEKLQYSTSKPVTSHDVAANVLNLRSEGCPDTGPVNRRCEVDWEIRAPAGTNLDLTNRAGGIELTGVAGTVVAKTDAGGVDGTGLTTKSITAQSDSGGVELAFTQVPDLVDATTRAGGVELRLPAGAAYSVDAESNTGTPEIEVQRDPRSAHKIKARTRAGGIEITNG